MKKLVYISYFVLLTSYLTSCTTIDIFEKTVAIPGHEWKTEFKPSFDFVIKDTNSLYNIFLVIRHTEKYSFNNIYINLYAKAPGRDSLIKIQQDVLLGTNDKGWLGVGMDDVYEHRSTLAARQPLKAGAYTFTIEQIMREEPLKEVLNVGLRLEKEK
ncbi:MAG: gliding motility lipoprotein GldH [Chitinophagaceae bacterium]